MAKIENRPSTPPSELPTAKIPPFLSKIMTALQKVDVFLYENLHKKFIIPLLGAKGIEVITSPRELQAKMVEMLQDAREVKMSVCAEWLYLMSLPSEVTPDSWEEISLMQEMATNRNRRGIKIVRPPVLSPPEIAAGWVDVTIPFSEDINYPLSFITPELEAKGMISQDGKCFVVKSRDALNWLEQSDPDAYSAFLEYMPSAAMDGELLIFDGDSCEVVGK